MLHSFGFDAARAEFHRAQQLDPEFALAYWGESLSYGSLLLSERDRESPRRTLLRLAEQPEARLAKAATERERGFLEAVEAL